MTGVQLNAIESRVGPRVDDDTQKVNYEEIRMLGHRFLRPEHRLGAGSERVWAARTENRCPWRRLSRGWAEHRSKCCGSLATKRTQKRLELRSGIVVRDAHVRGRGVMRCTRPRNFSLGVHPTRVLRSSFRHLPIQHGHPAWSDNSGRARGSWDRSAAFCAHAKPIGDHLQPVGLIPISRLRNNFLFTS